MADSARPCIDFDLFAARSRESSDDAWHAVRERGPVAWTERNGGHWVVSGYDAVADAFRDWEHFSSERTNPDQCAISFSTGKVPWLLPEESDPPAWQGYRRAIAQLLSPQASERLRARARYWTAHCLDQVIEQGECDFIHDLTCPVPAAVVCEWMGFPPDEWQWISDAFHNIAAFPNGTPEHHEASKAFGDVLRRVTEELDARWDHPRDDALSVIAHSEIDGERLSKEVAQAIAFLTLNGGVDTTTALTGAALIHLGLHPDDRARLLADPALFDSATEEFLRYYPPARTHARTVAVDTVFHGVEMKQGERVLLSEVAAGRDPGAFADPDAFVIDRYPNRHLSFGVGIHRCPGSHLARIEFAEMVTAVLARMPDYHLDADAVEEYPDWAMNGGWRHVPVTFAPGPRVLG